MVLRVTLILLSLCSLHWAVNFKQVARIPVGLAYSLGRVKALDANHNGRNNLIFGARYEMPARLYVAFWEHQSSNHYTLVDSITPIDRDYSWDIGYLDNDSLVDVITQHYDPDSITRNIAVFEAPDRDSYPTRRVWRWRYEVNGGATYRMMVTDLDQDGKKEILAIDAYVIYVFENVGDNNYQKVFSDTIRPQTSALALGPNGDFDSDGKTDFVMRQASRYLIVYECVGDDRYAEVFRDTLRSDLPNGYDLWGGNDLDGDGKPEFMVSACGGTWRYYLWVYEATADNRYEVVFTDSFYTGIGVMMADEVSNWGDIDCDGQDELIWAVKGNWLVYKATGNNTYERIFRAYPTWNRYYTTQTCIYDLNQNGYPEIVESGDSADASRTVTRTVLWEIEGVRLHRPNGGEVLQPGSQCPITWEKFTPPGADSFSLFVSYDNGVDYRTITTIRQSDDTIFLWSVPDTLSDSCKIMIWAYGPPRPGQSAPRGTAWDFSDSTFRIGQTGVREAMSNEQRAMSLRIIQNPTTARQGIRLLVTSPSPNAKLQIYDVSGNVVQSLPITNNQLLITVRCNAGGPQGAALPAGVYFVRLQAEGAAIIRKIVVLE